MSVKAAVEVARAELDRKWIEKYPHGEMRFGCLALSLNIARKFRPLCFLM